MIPKLEIYIRSSAKMHYKLAVWSMIQNKYKGNIIIGLILFLGSKHIMPSKPIQPDLSLKIYIEKEQASIALPELRSKLSYH